MAIDRSAILNRIKKIFEGLPQTKIAKICGVTHQAANRYFKKGLIPNYDAMLRISKYANVSMEWLLTGKGSEELLATAAGEAGVLSEATANISINTSAEYQKMLQNQLRAKAYVPIPLISASIAACEPLVIEEKDIENFVIVSQAWVKQRHTYRCLRVRGNSMHPIISDGFIVAINLTENDPLKSERQIIAARHKDGVVIKYLHLTERDYVLSPHNLSEYKPIVIPRTAPNPIIGKVAWWWGTQKRKA
ncbi:hypothetical protein CEE39_09735 [bacterium (candidate division B38) B3_B38]|nr:MAG: hypothetical protein CEE39_09735 [bacterium (candidate division B38) B3_B38]